MSVQVVTGVAPQWADHVGDDVPIHASAPWIGATSHRLTRRRLTFLAEHGGQRGGLMAAVVENPAADEMINLYGTLLADPKVWKFPESSVAARARLRGQVPPAADWVPHLAVMYPGFDTFVAADGGPSAGLVAGMIDGVLDWAAEHEMKAVTLPCVRADTALPQALAERGFRAIPLTYRSRLALRESFADYLAGLPRKWRWKVTNEQRLLADAGVRTKRCSIDDVWPDVLALRCDLVERYGQKASEELETINMRQLITCFGEDQTRLYCSSLDDRIVGFSLYAIWGDTWYGAYTGTYGGPQTRGVYFDHFFYAPIADASVEGAATLDVGIGAWASKRHRGCELTEVDLWVRALDPAVERAVEIAAAPMLREEGWVSA
ncbi:MAG TPA: GNAT family N-acetyltransferase [Streptosporangiaceae bacterium]|jgi:hypothetical protein